MRRVVELVAPVAIAITLFAAGPAAAADLMAGRNPGFETPQLEPGEAWRTIVEGSPASALGGWTVTRNSVELLGSAWQADTGTQSLELNGTSSAGPGGVKQTLPTTPSADYVVHFSMAANYASCGGSAVKTLDVYWDGERVRQQRFDATSATNDNMGWQRHQVPVEADGSSAELRFESTSADDANCGPVIDRVAVLTVPAQNPQQPPQQQPQQPPTGGDPLVPIKLLEVPLAQSLKMIQLARKSTGSRRTRSVKPGVMYRDVEEKLKAKGINATVRARPSFGESRGARLGEVLTQSPKSGAAMPGINTSPGVVKVSYYGGDVKGGDCDVKALQKALKGVPEAEAARRIDAACDDVTETYRFSKRSTVGELVKIRDEPVKTTEVYCESRTVDGERRKYCDLVNVPANTETHTFGVDCRFRAKDDELVCKVEKKKRKKKRDEPPVVQSVVDVPPDANDLLISVRDSEINKATTGSYLGLVERTWTLLTTNHTDERQSCIRVQVLDGMGQLLVGADVTPVFLKKGMGSTTQLSEGDRGIDARRTTGANGEVELCYTLYRKGTIRLVAEATGSNGGTIYGVKDIGVLDIDAESQVKMLDGRILKRTTQRGSDRSFHYEVVDPAALRLAAAQVTTGGEQLGPPEPAEALPTDVIFTTDTTAFKVGKFPAFPPGSVKQGLSATAAPGRVAVQGEGDRTGKIFVNKAGLIGEAGSNLIGEAGSNLIGQAGTNLIGQAGTNLIGQAGTNLIGQAGTNFTAAKGALIGQAGTNFRP